MTTYFIATESGQASSGYLVANGDAYVARSGSNAYGRGDIPQGSYKLGAPEGLNKGKKQDKSMAPKGSNWRKFRKFDIAGVGPGVIKDPRYPGNPRIGIKFHYDGNNPGTEGCIGYDDPAAQTALTNAYNAGDRDIKVIYVKSDAEARAMTKRLTGKEPPTSTRGGVAGGAGKKKAPAKPKRKPKKKAAQRKGATSKIKHGAKMAEGEPTVLLGKKRLKAAHRKARHTGGGRIAQGIRSVWVGKKLLAFGRVTDPTTDGSQVASGEDSVMVG